MTIMTDYYDDHDKAVEDPKKPPSVLGEESPSGDATSSESMDIDEELQRVGLHSDNDEGPQSLDLEDELKEEEF